MQIAPKLRPVSQSLRNSKPLGDPTLLNQMRLVWSFVFAKFFSSAIVQKGFCFCFITKKFFHTIFVEYLFLSTWVYNFRIKMFHQNGGQNFVLYYLIFTWVKFHVKITRFKLLGAPYSNECFPKTYLKLVF